MLQFWGKMGMRDKKFRRVAGPFRGTSDAVVRPIISIGCQIVLLAGWSEEHTFAEDLLKGCMTRQHIGGYNL
ncbi:MAG: hypothetical protein ACJAZ0_002127 [Halioglobus sp.]|jgi:hypothetical protein